jgi:putative ABC transport system substrate-binding protein
MKRREFITVLGGAAAWPFAARTEQADKVWRIGFLSGVPRPIFLPLYTAFLLGMQNLGYVEGRDFVTEWRSAEGDYQRFPGLAADLVRLKLDVIITGSTPGVRVLQQATETIPIVIAYSNDPVGNGLVTSLARPGGNTTGLAGSSDDTAPKQLEFLTAVVPKASRIGFLGNPASPNYSTVLKRAQAAAQTSNLVLVHVEGSNPAEIENAFRVMTNERVQAVMLVGDPVFVAQHKLLATLALRNRLPSIFAFREYVDAGGLMSYGENLSDFFQRAAFFVDKIFKGTKPSEIPVEQPTKFHLVINRKTAEALGVTIPPQLYIFADEVIE